MKRPKRGKKLRLSVRECLEREREDALVDIERGEVGGELERR